MSTDAASYVFQRHSRKIILVLAVIFSVAHTQAPLFYSNQNQYFLHGISAVEPASLGQDWLAQTLDPTPVFSKLVEAVYRQLPVYFFHLIFFVLCILYFLSLIAIAAYVLPQGSNKSYALLGVGTLLILAHAGISRLVSVRLFGTDYPWYLQSGLAGQYVLGPGLQPSAFGVLLIASIAAFVQDRLVIAVACSSAACVVHATYLLPAAFLTVGFMAALIQKRRVRASVLLGLATMILVLPTVIYTLTTFAPTSTELFRESQRILARVRIPHHALIERWLDPIAAVQIGAIFSSIILIRKTRLFLLLAIPAGLGLALSIVQCFWQNDSLALLFPWRISAVLMPIATTIICAGIAQRLPVKSWMMAVCLLLIAGVAAGGIMIQSMHLAYLPNEQETKALEYIRDHRSANEVYLLPVHIPKPAPEARSARSTSFMSPPTSLQKDLISIDLQRFRLFTHAPIYVDFKSIPYKDVEVLEWFRRLQKCDEWYTQKDWNNEKVHEELRREGVTHLLLPANQVINHSGYQQVYADAYYRIYALKS